MCPGQLTSWDIFPGGEHAHPVAVDHAPSVQAGNQEDEHYNSRQDHTRGNNGGVGVASMDENVEDGENQHCAITDGMDPCRTQLSASSVAQEVELSSRCRQL